MATYRNALPQLGEDLFLTDGGLETTLMFHDGVELPDFAAFDLLKSASGTAKLRRYFASYIALAQRLGTGLILETATWRANADWGRRLGYSARDLATANQDAVNLIDFLRSEYGEKRGKIVISGCVGPRGDGYSPGALMSDDEAKRYHSQQIDVLRDTAADMIAALTMNYADEAIGITRAAEHAAMPVAISFTVETDGRLPTGQTLRDAIEQVDAATAGYPAYYMINCAHPTHFERILHPDEHWTQRIRGVRSNASRMSHAELNESAELDSGNPVELGTQNAALKRRLPQLTVMGGCCGTDNRHIEQIAMSCAPLFPPVK